MTFLGFQAYEYSHAYTELNLKLSTGAYGATFFMLTGFHGFHVTIGTIMLIVILGRSIAGHFTAEHHFGFEGVAWYWHFVDVVWLLLFILVYYNKGQTKNEQSGRFRREIRRRTDVRPFFLEFGGDDAEVESQHQQREQRDREHHAPRQGFRRAG